VISFVSPGQINAFAPSDTYIGDMDIRPISPNGLRSPTYAVAHVGSEFIGKANLIAGLLTRPAKPGETLALYGTGFGPAVSPCAPENTVTGYSEVASPTTFAIGGELADVLFAGQTGSGFYPFNLKSQTASTSQAPFRVANSPAGARPSTLHCQRENSAAAQ